jgi:hypothetical protein
MKLEVTYQSGDPKRIKSSGIDFEQEHHFAVEGSTARLIDVRAKGEVEKGHTSLCVGDLNTVHDAVLRLPFIDCCTVWMRGRTDTTMEDDDA